MVGSDRYSFCSSTMPMQLENVINRQIVAKMPVKTVVKHLMRVRISSMIFTFFNGIDMNDYRNKR